jgi:CHAT domain-containing protein/tetratricopeptide (TPR) repeat protein
MEANERTLGKDHADTLTTVISLAILYESAGRYGEAEPLFKRALEGQERTLGKEHPDTLTSLTGLGSLYEFEGRYGDAEPLLKRALLARERVLGKEHPATLEALRHLAEVYRLQGRLGEAEPLYTRALEADGRVLGPNNPETLTVVNNLGELYDTAGRFDLAEPLLKHAAEARARTLGADHPNTLQSANTLAGHYEAVGKYNEAEALYKRVIESRQRALGPEHPEVIASLNDLAVLYMKRREWAQAAEYWRRSTQAIEARTVRGTTASGKPLTGQKSETELEIPQFRGFIKAEYLAAPAAIENLRETFQAAQWALGSEAARSLAQMASRGAKGSPALEALVRQRQDLVAEWQKRDARRNAALALAPGKRDAKTEDENLDRIAFIGSEIAGIDEQLEAEFPDYASLASPAPLAAEEVQALLGKDEALVLFLDTPEGTTTPEETFIWVVTKNDMRWVRSSLGTAELTHGVQALRCGLDEAAWYGDWKKCRGLVGAEPARDQDGNILLHTLPFDLARAHAMYRALFGEVEALLQGKSLLIAPAGPLTQLPFQVLVTKPAGGADVRSASWLIRDQALTILPAVSSLKALRRVARPSSAAKPMTGFGNPLLEGDPADADDQKRAEDARNFKRCPAPEPAASHEKGFRGVARVMTRGGFADRAFLLRQAPLPETAFELCAVARELNADPNEIHLGASATETQVKTLSRSGKLAQFRIVHFATHGALAEQIGENSEPGLLLTPPGTASEEDDGYLTASEIAGLRLDADWVMLSACNTAAGGAKGAEALSGLARAFIYAQARALLVSHWEVVSNATVKLITGAISRLAADKTMGRAEAMRQSMLALIGNGAPEEAHPAFWAPFVLVGEGGAGK